MLMLPADKKKGSLQGDQLTFHDEATVTQFNQHQQLEGIHKEQEEMQCYYMQKTNTSLYTLNMLNMLNMLNDTFQQ
ncbi:hypothetical protein ACO0LG_16915 [Undibacterium sp. Ji42W]|uniref:hypothetical protein n=1 Tax=Undibacterium sp. Ji42W TaxID=3413039 RepID=UPI003BF0588E